MLSVELRYILSLSIIFAVIIGIVRYRKIDRAYYPFIYYICLAVVIETAYLVLMDNGQIQPVRVMLNTFAFFEFGLLAWMFHAWGLFNGNRTFFIGLIIGFFVAWFVITFIIGVINKEPNLYFRILYSFALVLFAVSTFNKMVVNHRGKIFENAKFWICLGIIIFFTFFLLDNATKISLLKQNVSRGFRANLQNLIVYTNVLVNLLYAVAVLWIPRKKNFMTSF
jgi:hypothetical protein